MAEPFDVTKRDAKKNKVAPEVKYTLHDSDDEDPDTVETRKSLRQAEGMLQSRFFTNESDRKLYEARLKDGTLREAAKNFQEKDDKTTATEKEAADQDEDKKEKKVEAQKLKELEDDAEKEKVKAQKEFLDDKIKKDLSLLKDKTAAPTEKKEAAPAPFIPPELKGLNIPAFWT